MAETPYIFNIQKFSTHDGDGVRTTIFFKGCPLRCMWCHNPEGLSYEPQLMVSDNNCLHCGACQRECPGNAVPSVKDAERRLTVDFGEKKVWFGDVQMGRCTL